MTNIASSVRPDRDLTHPLERLKGILRRFLAYDVILFIGLFLTFWFWIGLGVDYGLFKLTGLDIAQQLTPVVRVVLFALLAALLALFVGLRVRRMLKGDLSLRSLALVLEKRNPKLLGDRLITAIEMADVKKAVREGYSEDMIEHTIREARERMAEVNVRSVFQWSRLVWKIAIIAAVSLFGLVLSLGIYGVASRSFDLGRGGKKLMDVAGIWTERNVLFQKTPWPRRAHIEVVDFDDEGHALEMRIGKGTPTPPKITARAYKWVVADNTSYDGWRPMKLSDAKPFANGAIPEASEDALVDDLERESSEQAPVRTLLAQLDTATDDVWNSRKIRKLVVPNTLRLRYDGVSTRARNFLELNPDASGKYVNEVAGLSESIKLAVSAEDFTTARRTITLVQPPTIVEFFRDEYQPAYLYHAAPKLSDDEKKPDSALAKSNPLAIQSEMFALRGLRQTASGKKIGITSDKSTFKVPVGTEVSITAVADKKLKKVELKPLTPNVKAEFLRTPTDGPFDTFGIVFDNSNPIKQLDKPTEFQIVMTDTDNVSSTRTIAIEAVDDAPPQVDAIVDPVVRRVAGLYWVTPIARLPFLPESKISDDWGLSDVRFEFKKQEEEAQSLVHARAMNAAYLLAMTAGPVGSWGMPGIVVQNQSLFNSTFGSTIPQKDSTGTERLPGLTHPRYAEAYGLLQRQTYDRIKTETGGDLPAERTPSSVKSIKLTDSKGDAFDFQDYMPELLEKKLGAIQARYKVDVFIVAKDGNVELTGKDGKPAEPKTARNLDPIRVMVVSEQDLLVEISKDEELQLTRIEDVMKKAYDGQRKLGEELSRLRDVNQLEAAARTNQLLSSQVRSTDIVQDVAKVRDILDTMQKEYLKLYREMETNRFGPVNMQKYVNEEAVQNKTGYLDLLKKIFDKSLPAAEKSLDAFKATLAQPQRPSDGEMATVRTDYVNLMRDLNDLLLQIGINRGITEAALDLKRIIDAQRVNGNAIDAELRSRTEALYLPEFVVPKLTVVAASKTIKIPLGIRWKLFPSDEYLVTVERPTGSDFLVPKEVKLKAKGEVDPFEIEITAATKPGVYTLILQPSTIATPTTPAKLARPVEITVEVTK